MSPYIMMERNGIHILDLMQTITLLNQACEAIADIVAEGKRVLFVGTKKSVKDIIRTEAIRCGQFYAVERWLDGSLTNFTTVRKSVKRLMNIEKMESDGTFDQISRKEALFLTREKKKLNEVLSGLVEMTRLPGALFVVDTRKEANAVKEAKRLGIPVFALVDTNCDPDPISYIIPANDDSITSVGVLTKALADAVLEGQQRIAALELTGSTGEDRPQMNTNHQK